MALFLGIVSQKGGVGKSTLARSVAREFAHNAWEVLIADMDTQQSTSIEWNGIRMENEIEPVISVQQFPNVERVKKFADQYDLVIFDGAPHSTKQTHDIAKVADFLVLPTGLSKDDQNPQIRLAHEMVKSGISQQKFAFAFSRIGASESQLEHAKEYMAMTGYKVLDGAVPEKDGYRLAIDEGKALTETPFKTLNQKADELIQQIVNELQK